MLDFNQVKADTEGKWPGIFSSFGIKVGNGKHGPCPICGGTDRFRFDDKAGRGTYICNQCGAGDGFKLIMDVMKIDFKEACEQIAKIIGTVEPSKFQSEPKASPEKLRELFVNSKPIKKGDPVTNYLHNRGLSDFPKTLRYAPKCWELETKMEQKAMLAVFTSPKDEAITIHRTYIKDGSKLDVDHPRKTMPPTKKMTGGAVRLYGIDKDVLGIAEGIETAICCKEQFKIPTWAALSAGLLEGFIPPKLVKHLVILSDNDQNYCGQKAAYTLANRLYKDMEVEVQVPSRSGEDWLDEFLRKR